MSVYIYVFSCIYVCVYSCHTHGGGGLAPKWYLTLETSWTVARQASLSMGILQARILEWVAICFFIGFS